MSFLTQAASEQYGATNYTRGQHGENIRIFDANNNPIDIGADIINFTWHEEYEDLNPKTITGKPKPISQPEMVSGSFTLLRYTGSLEQLFSDARAAFYADGTIGAYTIEQIIAPQGMPTSTIQITGVSLKFEDPGTYARDAAIEMRVSFTASDWRTI